MTKRRALWALPLLLGLLASAQARQAFPVDDSASLPVELVSPLEWRSLVPRGPQAHEATTTVRVSLRLDVRPWQGRRGQIYMALPAQPQADVQVKWQAQGQLMSGQLVSGSRGMVFNGVIDRPTIEDLLTVTVMTDGRLVERTQRLSFSFEIEPE